MILLCMTVVDTQIQMGESLLDIIQSLLFFLDLQAIEVEIIEIDSEVTEGDDGLNTGIIVAIVTVVAVVTVTIIALLICICHYNK